MPTTMFKHRPYRHYSATLFCIALGFIAASIFHAAYAMAFAVGGVAFMLLALTAVVYHELR